MSDDVVSVRDVTSARPERPKRSDLQGAALRDSIVTLGVRVVQEDVEHDDHCAICREDGELQQCHNCPRAFHPNCLHPPLKTPPRGPWYCPKCQKKVGSRGTPHAKLTSVSSKRRVVDVGGICLIT